MQSPSQEYYLHVCQRPWMPLTEQEMQGTNDGLEVCAMMVHTRRKSNICITATSIKTKQRPVYGGDDYAWEMQ